MLLTQPSRSQRVRRAVIAIAVGVVILAACRRTASEFAIGVPRVQDGARREYLIGAIRTRVHDGAPRQRDHGELTIGTSLLPTPTRPGEFLAVLDAVVDLRSTTGARLRLPAAPSLSFAGEALPPEGTRWVRKERRPRNWASFNIPVAAGDARHVNAGVDSMRVSGRMLVTSLRPVGTIPAAARHRLDAPGWRFEILDVVVTPDSGHLVLRFARTRPTSRQGTGAPLDPFLGPGNLVVTLVNRSRGEAIALSAHSSRVRNISHLQSSSEEEGEVRFVCGDIFREGFACGRRRDWLRGAEVVIRELAAVGVHEFRTNRLSPTAFQMASPASWQ